MFFTGPFFLGYTWLFLRINLYLIYTLRKNKENAKKLKKYLTLIGKSVEYATRLRGEVH